MQVLTFVMFLAEFFLFYQYCRELEFEEKPDYGYLHRLLRDLIFAESFNYAMAFQWLIEKQQIHSGSPYKANGQAIGKQRSGLAHRPAILIPSTGLNTAGNMRSPGRPAIESTRSSIKAPRDSQTDFR